MRRILQLLVISSAVLLTACVEVVVEGASTELQQSGMCINPSSMFVTISCS